MKLNKNEVHTVLYLMRSIHMDGRVLVNDKKIGVTGKGNATLKNRISQLSSTKNIFGAQCIAAWEISEERNCSALVYEKELHEKLKGQMVPCFKSGSMEWFYDDNEEDQFDVVNTVFEYAEKHHLKPIDLAEIQDSNAKILEKRYMKANFDDIITSVKSFLNIEDYVAVKTESCVRFTTAFNRSFHVNVRADLTKQYISISRTKQNIERYIDLSKDIYKIEISKHSGNLRVYVKSPREMAEIITLFNEQDKLNKELTLVEN